MPDPATTAAPMPATPRRRRDRLAGLSRGVAAHPAPGAAIMAGTRGAGIRAAPRRPHPGARMTAPPAP